MVLEGFFEKKLVNEVVDPIEKRIQEVTGWCDPVEDKISFAEGACQNYEVLVEDK